MNPCERVESLLSVFQDHETSPAETRYIDGHLTACKRCRTAFDDLELLRRRLQLLPSSQVSDGFTARVLDAALGRKPAGLDEPLFRPLPTFWSQWGVPLQAAAVLVLAVFLGLEWWGGRREDLAALQSPLKDAIQAVNEEDGADPRISPERTSLSEKNPGLETLEVNPTAIGLAGEDLVLEDWTFAVPEGGGQPVLTRVGTATTGNKVVVRY